MSNTVYKVGDEVEFLEHCGIFKIGDCTKVTAVDTDGTVRVRSLKYKNVSHWVSTNHVKLLTEFKVGTKIRCVSNTGYENHLTIGKVYTVLHDTLDPRYVRIKPDHDLLDGGYGVDRFVVLVADPVLTPEEVFEHLRKGTKLEHRRTSQCEWVHQPWTNPSFRMITEGQWRIKPEPEVIELNGKRYKLIED